MAFSEADPLSLQGMVLLFSLETLAVNQLAHGDAEDIHVVRASLAPFHVPAEGRSPGGEQRLLRRRIQIFRSLKSSSALPNLTNPSPVSISRMALRDSVFGTLTSKGSP